MKKLKFPTSLTGEQIWQLVKGDGSGDEISIDFVKDFALEKNINLNLNDYERIFISQNEKALKHMKHTRRENTLFIDLANKLKDVPKTDNSFRYSFRIDSEKNESNFILGIMNLKKKMIAFFLV